MESRGRTEGESGVLSENILKDFCKDGSEKEGEVTGLCGGKGVGPEETRGGKSASVNKGEGETQSRGEKGEGCGLTITEVNATGNREVEPRGALIEVG